MKTCNPAKKSLAFTLTELLTVIAIIAVLAALSLAAFSSAKQKAHQIHCANNVRQLGLVLQQFVGDYHVYPLFFNPGFFSGSYQEHHSTWISAIERTGFSDAKPTKEFLNKGVWHCPSAQRPPNFPGKRGYAEYGYNAYGVCPAGATNSLGLGGHQGSAETNHGTNAPPVSESEVAVPVDMIAMGDAFNGNNGVVGNGINLWRTQSVLDPETASESARRVQSRHKGKANILFCDGHVEALKLKLLFEDNDIQALSRWNRDHQPHANQLAP